MDVYLLCLGTVAGRDLVNLYATGRCLVRKSVLIKLTLIKKYHHRASLVAQWLRVCLLMQGTRVRALVWEDPTCHGAAGPVSHGC